MESKINNVNQTIEKISKYALYIALTGSKMEIVQNAYEEYYTTHDLQKASKKIENIFIDINKTIYQETGYEPRIHFHLPPAISFCRCWSKVRGDDISDFRNSVLRVSENKKAEKGIEKGRAGFVIRGVAPIFSNQGKYYGSIEAFFNINHLVKEINLFTKEEFAIFMNKDLLKIATNFLEDSATNIKIGEKTFNNYILVEKNQKFKLENILLKESKYNDLDIFNIENFTYTIISIKNILGKQEGIGILQIDLSESKKKLKEIIYTEIFVFLILISAIVFLLSLRHNRLIISKIELTDLKLQKLAEGEITYSIKTDSNDEICNMQNSLNRLNNKLIKNINFAVEIGNGNLEAKYETPNKNDLLGNALIEMRKKLIQYADDYVKSIKNLEISEEKFKKLSNLTFEGILIHKKGIAIDFNQSLAKMFGYNLKNCLIKI
ncbi:MAG: hypothetical protein JXA16_13675 [Bacteroidales bacterium]|nr:hypothetical protein [Bacteroidales bacterium]